ncbi:AAA family ATPase [Microbulbifer sp. VAAF005]|uniref:AAA family ATPase n=1 Tax=Microbulbifer sp. VAAF005 TaxID=3034230 RepID=UPI0024ACB549|nr:AAA family ATPase [Microbulbifer sp. VAAF005]WHI44625.1 AAA family ATPase [Microbulbifer sp. VAAF005]
MARADLVLSLVETGIKGDLPRFKKTAEALAAEAASRQHHHLAEKLRNLLVTSVEVNQQKFTFAPELQNAFYELPAQKILDDLTLPNSVVSTFKEIIEEQARKDLLRSYNLEPRHKILLSGPPGNGKTTLAEAFANHLSIPLYVVKYEGIINRFLGESAQNLDMLFEHVKSQRCVLFFDEFDAISKEREDLNESGEIKRVVNSLLKQIDMLPSHVVVIGATNHASMLDKAVWRRFQVQIDIPRPTKKMAEKWFDSFQERIGHSLGFASSTLAQHLSGLSFAELEEFGLDVQRRYVLSLPDSTKKIKSITTSRLSYWKNRYKNTE